MTMASRRYVVEKDCANTFGKLRLPNGEDLDNMRGARTTLSDKELARVNKADLSGKQNVRDN